MVMGRLQADRRTGSVHRPKTGVLPTVLRNQLLVDTADTDKTRQFCLVRVGGMNRRREQDA